MLSHLSTEAAADRDMIHHDTALGSSDKKEIMVASLYTNTYKYLGFLGLVAFVVGSFVYMYQIQHTHDVFANKTFWLYLAILLSRRR